jgi:hypothetical protein
MSRASAHLQTRMESHEKILIEMHMHKLLFHAKLRPWNAKNIINLREERFWSIYKIIALLGYFSGENRFQGSGILINIYAGGNFCSFGHEHKQQWETQISGQIKKE